MRWAVKRRRVWTRRRQRASCNRQTETVQVPGTRSVDRELDSCTSCARKAIRSRSRPAIANARRRTRQVGRRQEGREVRFIRRLDGHTVEDARQGTGHLRLLGSDQGQADLEDPQLLNGRMSGCVTLSSAKRVTTRHSPSAQCAKCRAPVRYSVTPALAAACGDFLVAHGPAGMHDRLDAGIGQHLQPVGEREERIRGRDRAAYADRPPVSTASLAASTRLT